MVHLLIKQCSSSIVHITLQLKIWTFQSVHNASNSVLQVCDMKFSELIPCLDRNLIYQLKLKVNLTLMEHYERHCPPPERRYNCLIPPPIGYKVCFLCCLIRVIFVFASVIVDVYNFI